VEVTPAVLTLAALAARHSPQAAATHARASPWQLADAFQPNLPARIELTLSAGGRAHRVRLTLADGEPCEALVLGAEAKAARQDGTRLGLAGVSVTDATVSAVIDDERQSARWFRRGAHLHVWSGEAHQEFTIEDPRTQEFTASAASGGLTTPLPGIVAAVPVEEGQTVAAGEVLMVIEAMKMEHSITAPHDGVVRAIHFARGDRVPEGSELLTLSRAGDSAS
jgi:3-methylcrotonyl-CoA carboxylase alpha subunit